MLFLMKSNYISQSKIKKMKRMSLFYVFAYLLNIWLKDSWILICAYAFDLL